MTLEILLAEQHQIDNLARQEVSLGEALAALADTIVGVELALVGAVADEQNAAALRQAAQQASVDSEAASQRRTALVAEREDHQRRIDEITARIAEINAQLADGNRDPRLQRELALLEARHTPLVARVAEIDAAIAGLDQQLAALRELTAALPARTAACDATVSARVRLDLELAALRQRQAANGEARIAAAQSRLALSAAHAGNLARLLEQLDPAVPIVLMPVRLETRFAQGNAELLVRVYPDDIHQDSHEPELTIDEETWGKEFWTRLWVFGPGEIDPADERMRLAEWQRLAGRFGPRRAEWIVAALLPDNMEAWRAVAPGSDAPLIPTVSRRRGVWTRPAQARCLPDRWRVTGYIGERRVCEQWGGLIPPVLHTGPDPLDTLASETIAAVPKGMAWMVDFDAAERVGMGIRVTLPAEARNGVDRLLVVGVRGTGTPLESATDLGRLLDGHRHTWGLDLVPQGSPTNNTETARSAFASRDDGYEDRYQYAIRPLLAAIAPALEGAGDAAALADALGVPHVQFQGLPNSALAEQRDARHMQHVLWPSTWGYYLREGFASALRERLTDLDAWREYFRTYVRGRGPLPTLRTGRQPYGVLPVTSLEYWQPETSEPEVFLLYAGRASRDVHYSVGWDLQADNTIAGGWSEPQPVPGGPGVDTLAIGAAMALLRGQPSPALFVLRAAAGPEVQIVVVRGLQPNGTFAGGVSRPVAIPSSASEPVRNASLWIDAPLHADAPDVYVLCQLEGVRGRPGRLVLRIGRGVTADGHIEEGWSDEIEVPGRWGDVIDVAVAAQDFDGFGELSLVVASLVRDASGTTVRVQVGTGLRGDSIRSWSGPTVVHFPEVLFSNCTGMDLAFYKTQPSPSVDAVLTISVEAGGDTTAFVWTKKAVDLATIAQGWQRTAPAYSLPAGATSVGIAAWDLGRRRTVPLDGGEIALVNLLSNLSVHWRTASTTLPHFAHRDGAGAIDPDLNLLQSLAVTALGSELAVRPAFGPDYLSTMFAATDNELPGGVFDASLVGILDVFRALGLGELAAADLAEPLRWARIRFARTEIDVREPWVQRSENPEREGLARNPAGTNYLRWLAKATPQEVHDGNLPPDVQPSILFRLLRHALLQEYADVARRRESGTVWPLPMAGEPELVDAPVIFESMLEESVTRTQWRLLSLGLGGQPPAGEVIHAELTRAPLVPDLAALDDTRRALDALADRPIGVLERLTKETLDLGSHRLDAWITSVATRRLVRSRATVASGVHVGGYGWVEDLRPRPPAQAMSDGYVQAPSLNHAATAAILRSAYLAHQGDGTADQMAVDLSSRRVRAALRLLDGVREGQALGALLGYEFERALHEGFPGLELDRYIETFRSRYPVAVRKLTPTVPADAALGAEVLGARNVVDGVLLVRRFQAGAASGAWDAETVDWTAICQLASPPPGGFPQPYPESGAIGQAEIEYNAIVHAVHTLEDDLDAVADLLTSESVFQTVQGNYLRSGASLDALGRGEAPPAEYDVLRTPRTGIGVTHALGVAFDAAVDWADPLLTAWLTTKDWRDGRSPRALAEPRLNRWLAQVLPDPSTVFCSVEYRDSNGAPLALVPSRVAVADLAVAPIDALQWMTEASEAQMGELERRVLDAESRATVVEATVRRQIRFTRTAALRAEDVSFAEFLEMTRAIRSLLADARPLAPEDLAALGVPATAVNVDEFVGRSDAALKAFDQLAGDVADRLMGSAAVEEIDGTLRAVAALGVFGAMPLPRPSDADDDAWRASLETHLRVVSEHVRTIAAALAQLPEPPGAKSRPRDVIDYHTTRLKTLFGRGFLCLPIIDEQAASLLHDGFTRRDDAGDAPADALEAWLHRAAQVRPAVRAFETVMLYAETLGAGEAMNLRVAQTPRPATKDAWIGGQMPDAAAVSRAAGTMGWVVQQASASLRTLAGIAVDRWNEVIPSPTETSAVAFHCDAPQASAPQAILLAVSPNPRQPWDAVTLEAVLNETAALARLRIVDLERNVAVGHILPALLLARNLGDSLRGDTIATNYDRTPGEPA